MHARRTRLKALMTRIRARIATRHDQGDRVTLTLRLADLTMAYGRLATEGLAPSVPAGWAYVD